ncbi:MAG: hypothetical protein ACT4ON_02685 [Bacteroidota bacterium]
MKFSDDLFFLIKSLTKAEKRHFKIFGGFYSGDKKIFSLFDAIDRQEEYDEVKLCKMFGEGESQFPWAKNRLHKLILKSTSSFHRGNTVDSEIKELLEHVDVLHKKALYKQSLKQIEKAKDLALRYEKDTLMPEILRMEYTVMAMTENAVTYIKNYPQQVTAALDRLKSLNDFAIIATKLWAHYGQEGIPRRDAEMVILDEIRNDPKLNITAEHSLSIREKVSLYTTHAHYYRTAGNPEMAYFWAKKSEALMVALPDYFEENINDYIIRVNQLLVYILVDMKRAEECMVVINKIKSFANKKSIAANQHILTMIFTISYLSELMLNINTRQFAKGAELIGEIERGLKKYSRQINAYEKVKFYYAVGVLYLNIKEYKKALLWVNKVLDNSDVAPAIQPAIRIMNIAIHYKLGNWEILEHPIRSAYRFLKKGERIYECETTFLRYMKKISRIDSKKESTCVLMDLRKKLFQIFENPYEKNALAYFDIIFWIDNEIDLSR